MELLKQAAKYIGANVATHEELVKYYNDNCYPLIPAKRKYKMNMGDNWCAMFTSVIAHKCGLSYDQFPYEVSVGEQVKLARSRGNFTQNMERAKPGDLIIFNWNGDSWPDHVGFIEVINGGIIGTIEGNYRKTVGRRNIAMNSLFIVGAIQI